MPNQDYKVRDHDADDSEDDDDLAKKSQRPKEL
jgi:hypothetical protein